MKRVKEKQREMLSIHPTFTLKEQQYGWHLKVMYGEGFCIYDTVFSGEHAVEKASKAIVMLRDFRQALYAKNLYIAGFKDQIEKLLRGKTI